jgi:hypothetical protein
MEESSYREKRRDITLLNETIMQSRYYIPIDDNKKDGGLSILP